MHKNSFAPLAAESSGEPPSDAFGPTAKDWINKIMSILESLQAWQQKYGPIIDNVNHRQGNAEAAFFKMQATVEEHSYAIQNFVASFSHEQRQDREMRLNQEARISSLENRIAEGNQALQEAKQLAAQVKFDAEIAKDSPLKKGKELDRLVI